MLVLLQSIQAHEGKGWSVAWNHTGEKLASCGEDKVAKVWSVSASIADHLKGLRIEEGKDIDLEVAPGSWVKTAEFGSDNHQRSIRDVSWSPCGNYLVLSSFDALVTLWEGHADDSFECLSVVEGHENEVKSVDWSPSGKFFASSGRDKNVMIWIMVPDSKLDVECSGVMTSHTQDVKRVVWHPHEDILASASYDDTIKIYKNDVDDGDWTVDASLEGHQSTCWGIDFDSTGNRLASCSDDKSIKIWNRDAENRWSCACTIGDCHERAIYDISWNKSNGLIATACGDDHVRIFKEVKGTNELTKNIFELAYALKAHDADVNSVKWNPRLDGVLATTSDDGSVKIWQWKDDP